MSVRNGLLALLAEGPMHGYQLRQEFEHRTGGAWPLNIGQVYTTVHRLVRDGLVEPVPQGGTGPQPDDGQHGGAQADVEPPQDASVERFRLTDAGRAEESAWWSTPVERGVPVRDELAIKLALAVTAPGVDVRAVIQAQRTETLRALRDLTRLKAVPPSPSRGARVTDRPVDERADLAWTLVLDSLVFAAEAEVRWLDHVEARVARAAQARRSRAAGPVDGATVEAVAHEVATAGAGTPRSDR